MCLSVFSTGIWTQGQDFTLSMQMLLSLPDLKLNLDSVLLTTTKKWGQEILVKTSIQCIVSDCFPSRTIDFIEKITFFCLRYNFNDIILKKLFCLLNMLITNLVWVLLFWYQLLKKIRLSEDPATKYIVYFTPRLTK